MTTTTTKTITITMSERPPVKLRVDDWPKIAEASHHDGQVECQANTVWYLRVREHADGRRVVYGAIDSGGGGQYVGFRSTHAGYLVEARDSAPDQTETIRAIRRVAGVLDDDRLAAECIGDLPAETL